MKKVFLLLAMFWMIIATSQSGFAACRVDMGKDWRTVGGGKKVKLVCTGNSCSGNGNYVIVKQLGTKKIANHGMLASMKASGKKTSSPIPGFAGFHVQQRVKKAYRIYEIYYNPSSRKSDMVFIEAVSGTQAAAQPNFAKAKSTIKCF